MNYAKLEQRSNVLLEQNRLFEINLDELGQECPYGACTLNVDYGYDFAIQFETVDLDTEYFQFEIEGNMVQQSDIYGPIEGITEYDVPKAFYYFEFHVAEETSQSSASITFNSEGGTFYRAIN